MTTVSIDNDPISVQLAAGESTTVPSGEIWDVTIAIASDANVRINNIAISNIKLGQGEPNTDTVDTVLQSGDEVMAENSDGAHIGGYEVSP